MKEAVDYAVALRKVSPEIEDSDVALELAFMFLEPWQVFRLWLGMLVHRYWKQ